MSREMKKDFLSTTAGVLSGAVVANLLWGSASPCIKLGYQMFQVAAEDTMSQILFAGTRFFIAGILTIIMGSFLKRHLLIPKHGSIGMIITLALLQTVIQYTFFYIGLSNAPGFKGSITSPTSTFFAILISALIFHQETLTWKKICGCLIGFAGVVLINLGSGSAAGFQLNGEGFLIMAAASYGCSSVFIKRYSEREDPVVLSGYQFALGGAAMTLVAFLAGGRLHAVSGAAWLMMLYLGMLSAVAYTIWSLLLQRHPVSRITVYAFLNPVFGVVLSALLLGEGKILNIPRCILAMLFVCAGVWMVNRPEKAFSQSY
ncbi:MAG: DMT family transporter [Oscillospiraceae bacterium]|nr:DMT family transporter [Oscillospiraceae bacterium]